MSRSFIGSFISVNEYVEAMLFCILEEIGYMLAEATHTLLARFHLSPNHSPQTNTPNLLDSDASQSKGDEWVTGLVTSMGDETGSSFLQLRIDRKLLTPYKWNEVVLLLSSQPLAKAAGKPPALFYGVSGSLGEVAGDLTVSFWASKALRRQVRVGKQLYLYSLIPFTGFLR